MKKAGELRVGCETIRTEMETRVINPSERTGVSSTKEQILPWSSQMEAAIRYFTGQKDFKNVVAITMNLKDNPELCGGLNLITPSFKAETFS